MTGLARLLSQARQLELGDIPAWPRSARRALMISLWLIASLLALVYVALPRQQALIQAQRQGQKLKQKLKQHQARAATLPAYQAYVARRARELRHQLTRLPDQSELDDLRDKIARLRARHELQDKLFKPLPRHERSLHTVWPHELILRGQFRQLAGFISQLAALPQLVTLHDLTLRPTSDTEATAAVLEARLQLHLYHDHADQAGQVTRLLQQLEPDN